MPNKGDSKSSIYDRREPRKGQAFADMKVKVIPRVLSLKTSHPENHGLVRDGK